MRRHPKRSLLRQFLAQELAVDLIEDVQCQVEGGVRWLLTVRHLMAIAEWDPRRHPIEFLQSGYHYRQAALPPRSSGPPVVLPRSQRRGRLLLVPFSWRIERQSIAAYREVTN